MATIQINNLKTAESIIVDSADLLSLRRGEQALLLLDTKEYIVRIMLTKGETIDLHRRLTPAPDYKALKRAAQPETP